MPDDPRQFASDVVALLDRIQWSGDGDGSICPECGNIPDEGHARDCALDRLRIRAARLMSGTP